MLTSLSGQMHPVGISPCGMKRAHLRNIVGPYDDSSRPQPPPASPNIGHIRAPNEQSLLERFAFYEAAFRIQTGHSSVP